MGKIPAGWIETAPRQAGILGFIIAHCDLSGHYLRVNQKYCDILCYSREQLLAKTFQEITLRDDLDVSFNKFSQLVQGKISSYSDEKRIVRKNGELVWTYVTVSLQMDTKGNSATAKSHGRGQSRWVVRRFFVEI